jgi:hypothetical protein
MHSVGELISDGIILVSPVLNFVQSKIDPALREEIIGKKKSNNHLLKMPGRPDINVVKINPDTQIVDWCHGYIGS